MQHFTAVTTKEYEQIRKNLSITYGYGFTPFGNVLLATTQECVCYMEFIDTNQDSVLKRFIAHWPGTHIIRNDTAIEKKLNAISASQQQTNLLAKGSDFEITVYKALLRIPKGTLVSYSELAASIYKPKAARAVAQAVASNTIACLIPCHRVIAKDGTLGGYRWGRERKRKLIEYERNPNATL